MCALRVFAQIRIFFSSLNPVEIMDGNILVIYSYVAAFRVVYLLLQAMTVICPLDRRAISILSEICDGRYYCNLESSAAAS